MRVTAQEKTGEAYVAGTLSSGGFYELERFLREHPALFQLRGTAPVDAAFEELGVWWEGHELRYTEAIGTHPALKHEADFAELREVLMKLPIGDAKPVEKPWDVPSEGWFRS